MSRQAAQSQPIDMVAHIRAEVNERCLDCLQVAAENMLAADRADDARAIVADIERKADEIRRAIVERFAD